MATNLAVSTNGHSNNAQINPDQLTKDAIAKKDFRGKIGIPSVGMINAILTEYGVEPKAVKASVISAENQLIVTGIWQLMQTQGKTLTDAAHIVKAKVQEFNAEQSADAIQKRVEPATQSGAINQRGQEQAADFNQQMMTQLKAEALETGARWEQLKLILIGAARNSSAVQNDPRVQQAREVALTSSPTTAILNDEVFAQMLADGVNFFQ